MDGRLDEGSVVLEGGANLLGGEEGPDVALQDARGLGAPDGEVVGVESVRILHALDDG